MFYIYLNTKPSQLLSQWMNWIIDTTYHVPFKMKDNPDQYKPYLLQFISTIRLFNLSSKSSKYKNKCMELHDNQMYIIVSDCNRFKTYGNNKLCTGDQEADETSETFKLQR